jgi:hypothetical protein
MTPASTSYDVTTAKRMKSYDLTSAIDYDVNLAVNNDLSGSRLDTAQLRRCRDDPVYR